MTTAAVAGRPSWGSLLLLPNCDDVAAASRRFVRQCRHQCLKPHTAERVLYGGDEKRYPHPKRGNMSKPYCVITQHVHHVLGAAVLELAWDGHTWRLQSWRARDADAMPGISTEDRAQCFDTPEAARNYFVNSVWPRMAS